MSDVSTPTQPAGGLAGLLISVLFSAVVLYVFHDLFWYGPDEGAYAHVAERMLNGEILGRDVKDIHAGYINYVNALAMAVFGETLLSMRYPLVAMGLIEAGLIYWLVAPSGRVVALAASVVFTSLSTVQFLNPTANWYALFITTVLIFLLSRHRDGAGPRLEVIGFLLITLFLFRQLSGVIVALGVVAWLIPRFDDGTSQKAVLGRGVLGIMALGLAGFLWSKTEIVGFLLFGIWPFGILILLLITVQISDRAMWRLIWRLSLGGLLAFVPLVTYHAVTGSIGDWFNGSFIAVLDVANFNFGWYGWLFALAAANAAKFSSVHEVANSALWFLLLSAPCVIGVVVWYRLFKDRGVANILPPILFIPPFYGLVSITHYQIPIYLFYGAGLILAGLCFASGSSPKGALRPVLSAICIFLSGVALYYQAGQPIGPQGRGLGEVVAGKRSADWAACPSDKCGLRIQRPEAMLYGELLGVIESNSRPDDTILVLPANPEVYFLSGRRSPVAFYNSALGITDEAQLSATLKTVESQMPKLVIYSQNDKYNSPLTQKLWEALKPRFELKREIGGFVVFGRAE